MIIKKINQIKLDKIIKDEDIAIILSAQEYEAKIKQEGEQIIANAHAEVQLIRQRVTEELTQKFTEENAKHLNELNDKVGVFLQQLNEDIYTLVYKLLVKLGVEVSNTAQIKQLIGQELTQVSGIDEISITANKKVIAELKEEFSDTRKLSFDWYEEQSLLDYECICSTKLWTLRLNTATVVEKLRKFCIESNTEITQLTT